MRAGLDVGGVDIAHAGECVEDCEHVGGHFVELGDLFGGEILCEGEHQGSHD